MRIVVPVVVEMTNEQVGMYAAEQGLARRGYVLHDSDVREDVRGLVLTATQGLFDGMAGGATVTLKERGGQ